MRIFECKLAHAIRAQASRWGVSYMQVGVGIELEREVRTYRPFSAFIRSVAKTMPEQLDGCAAACASLEQCTPNPAN